MSFKLVLVSGSGIGAGKTTLAKRLGCVFSLADALRHELSRLLPGYDWFNRTQEYKRTLVSERGCTVRDVMIQHGQAQCIKDPAYWVNKTADVLTVWAEYHPMGTAVVDDVRKVLEVQALRARFGPAVTHVHLLTRNALPEAEFENEQLCRVANYHVQWDWHPSSLSPATETAATGGAVGSGTDLDMD